MTTPQGLGGSGRRPKARDVSSVVGRKDTDGDGLIDGDEFQNNGDPRKDDTDADGLEDRAELDTYGSNLGDADSDNDSLPPSGGPRNPRLFDGNEVKAGPASSPRNPDTDGDSLGDFYEIVIGDTNPALADLPKLGLGAVAGTEKVQIDLPFTVSQTDGTENQTATASQTSSSQRTSTATSRQTTHAVSQSHQVGGSCTVSTKSSGCTVSYKYTNTTSDSTTRGSQWGFANTRATTQTNQQLAQTSAQRQVRFEAAGCLQVLTELNNAGAASVTVKDIQLDATFPDPSNPGSSKLLATMLPISGEIYSSPCPATEDTFVTTIPAGGTETVGFSQQVSSGILREYMANPTPIQFDFGAITMTGTNSAGQKVNFSGDVADAVSRQDASITVDYGDGTIRTYQVTASIERRGGGAAGITLKEALGPELANLAPEFTGSKPSYMSGLRNPVTGKVVENASPARDGAWNLVGDAKGIGKPNVAWDEVVLKPGDEIALSYTRDSDRDRLDDGQEVQLGTDPQAPDTDGDGLDDFLETQTGWTVPLARGGQQEYTVRPSPLSCDGDGDGSPDGPGPGNSTYGACPQSSFPPESKRADTGGNAGLAGTDPKLADTNADGLLDGEQAYPDVLREVGKGGRVPEFLVQWGGTGTGGGLFQQAGAIAIDHAQPIRDKSGDPAPIDSYVVDRRLGEVAKFSGNPAEGRGSQPVFEYGRASFGGGAGNLWSTQGIAVTSQTTGSGEAAGRVVVTNNYSLQLDARIPSFLQAGNGATGSNVGGQIGYPGDFQHGFIDANQAGQIYIARGVGDAVPQTNNANPNALPCLMTLQPNRDDSARCLKTYGRKARDPSNPQRGELVDPSGLAYDAASQTLYVADDVGISGATCSNPSKSSVTAFDATTGAVTGRLSAAPVRGRQLCPAGVAVDPSDGYVYVANQGSSLFGTHQVPNMVWKLSPSLTVLARWGTYDEGHLGGRGTFNAPYDLDVDSSHAVWVTDSGSNLIQYFFYPFGPD